LRSFYRCSLNATDAVVVARVATIAINPREITVLHLHPEFESTIRMPEEVTSVILGSPGEFKAEHSADEPNYVYVKPITKEPAQSNLLIAMKSGQHVTLELVSDGASIANQSQPVDFLIEYSSARSFLIPPDSGALTMPTPPSKEREHGMNDADARHGLSAAFQPRRRIQGAGESECSQMDQVGRPADRDIDWRHAAVEHHDFSCLACQRLHSILFARNNLRHRARSLTGSDTDSISDNIEECDERG
jgi:hypothetical protein